MNMRGLRKIFEKNWLPVICGECVMQYIQKTMEGQAEEFLRKTWAQMICKENKNPEDYPIDITVENGMWSDDRICYSLIKLPDVFKKRNDIFVIYGLVVFDSKMKKRPRFFVGETDYCSWERKVFIAEYVGQTRSVREILCTFKDGRICPTRQEDEIGEFVCRVVNAYQKEHSLLKDFAYWRRKEGMGEIIL